MQITNTDSRTNKQPAFIFHKQRWVKYWGNIFKTRVYRRRMISPSPVKPAAAHQALMDAALSSQPTVPAMAASLPSVPRASPRCSAGSPGRRFDFDSRFPHVQVIFPPKKWRWRFLQVIEKQFGWSKKKKRRMLWTGKNGHVFQAMMWIICRRFTSTHLKRKGQDQLTTHHNSWSVDGKTEGAFWRRQCRVIQVEVEKIRCCVNRTFKGQHTFCKIHLFVFLLRVRGEDRHHSHVCPLYTFSFFFLYLPQLQRESLYGFRFKSSPVNTNSKHHSCTVPSV